MKMKRFVDTNMRQVLRQVREDQGPDAVILSNRRVEGGIEIIAAVDYDEALVQQALGSAPSPSPTQPVAVNAPETEKKAPQQRIRRRGKKGTKDRVKVVSTDLQATNLAPPDRNAEPVKAANDAGQQESTLELMQSEIINMRDMLETQLRNTESIEATIDAGRQDSTLESMQSEIINMRGMLETQLSSLVWRDTATQLPMRAQILRNLTKIGIGPDVAHIIVNRLEPIHDAKELWRAPLATLANTIPLVDDGLLRDGGVAALVGPTGVGKTTTIAKMASRYAMQFGANKIALISADAHRIGAHEQLSTFANILGVKIYPAENLTVLEELLDQLSDKELVLIDTEGTSQRDITLTARLAAYGKNEDRVRFYLTLAATCQEAGLDETLRIFNRLPLSGAIITRIDEAAQLGCVLSALIRHDLPAAFLSDGQRVPDDLHDAAKKRLWLINQAIECMRSSEIRIDEDMMIERFGSAGISRA